MKQQGKKENKWKLGNYLSVKLGYIRCSLFLLFCVPLHKLSRPLFLSAHKKNVLSRMCEVVKRPVIKAVYAKWKGWLVRCVVIFHGVKFVICSLILKHLLKAFWHL